MASYDKLTPAYRNYFKKLREEKPDVELRGKKLSWDQMVQNVKVLSEPVSAVNHEKLSMQNGLAMRWVSDSRGRITAQ